MKSIKVLAIDAGGIRGVVPAVILAEIQKRLGADLYKSFDLISGTSTGGIVALGVATRCHSGGPYSPDQLVNLYVENGPAIFQKTIFTPVRQLVAPKYSPDSLQETVVKFFGQTQLDTAFMPLLISSYDLQGQLPFFFKSHKIAARPHLQLAGSLCRTIDVRGAYMLPALSSGAWRRGLRAGGRRRLRQQPPPWLPTPKRAPCTTPLPNSWSFRWAPAIVRTRSPTRRRRPGACSAGPRRSCRYSWTASPMRWTTS